MDAWSAVHGALLLKGGEMARRCLAWAFLTGLGSILKAATALSLLLTRLTVPFGRHWAARQACSCRKTSDSGERVLQWTRAMHKANKYLLRFFGSLL